MQAAIELLATDPRPASAVQLVGGAGEWRGRTGNLRIVHEVHAAELVVRVVEVGHRRDVHDAADPIGGPGG